ncbi:MAG: tRNA preQ1(34) S-adenosylmethionine ribosyltransferase-isomerase QueA [Fimbriimonas sp.]
MERLSDYTYELPGELIAQQPLLERSASRLLVLNRDGRVEHCRFTDVLELLHEGDLLVMNDTRVSAVRLFGRKATGGAVEALLLRELQPGLYEAMVKPTKSLRRGVRVSFGEGLHATVDQEAEGLRVLRFSEVQGLAERLETVGLTPLPPYIHEHLADRERYQTVYAAAKGSAAAPTAGLHFTPQILAALCEKGVETATVTLDVSIDTFRPVQVEDLDQHKMHGERCTLPTETAAKIGSCPGRIIAVGTTTVRTLESFAKGPRKVESGSQISKLFIRPGFEFQIIDGMFTNFHLPGTTMMLMISALAGREHVLQAYRQAVAKQYRFLSFGDSMLII